MSEWYVRWLHVAPFGDEWRQTGLLAAIIANCSPNRTRESKVFNAEDFMPILKQPEKGIEQGVDDQKELAKIVHQSLGLVPTQ